MSTPDSAAKINLALTSVLLLDASAHSLEIIAQIVKGFGAQEIHRCTTIAEAERVLQRSAIDLILVDPDLKDEDGFEFLRALRNNGPARNRYAPIILLSGHARSSSVARARDTGANFFVVKPISTRVLLDRILWIGRDPRPFVAVDSGFCGPDRRFKFIGPPDGSEGRRAEDLSADLGAANEPNMSQLDIDSLIKPQKVSL